MFVKQALTSFSKATSAYSARMTPLLTSQQALVQRQMPSFGLLRASMASFSSTNSTSKTAAETPATHMHRTMSLDRSITSFFEQQTGKGLALDSITQFMNQTLMRGPMSYSEHQEYHPIVDELVFYVTQWYGDGEAKSASNSEAQTLLTFGLAFEVEDAKYWRAVKQLAEDSLAEVKGDTVSLMDTLTYMKEAGVATNKALREVSTIVNQLDTLTAGQLVEFTMIFSSQAMQSAVDISEQVSQLEHALIAKQGELSLEDFAMVCSVVAFDDTPDRKDDFTVKLPHFLHENLERTEQWLAGDEFIDMQDFVHVSAAYLSMYDVGEVPQKLLQLMEKTVERNALNLDAQQAINLAVVFAPSASSFTMEVFDRVIGSQVDTLSVNQVFDAFMAFSRAQNAEIRPKIQSLLLSTMQDCLDQLLPCQLLDLCSVLLSKRKGETKDGSGIIIGLDIDRFLLHQIGSLDQLELLQALEVFADSDLVEVQQAVESQLIQSMRLLSPEVASELLYKLTSRMLGSRTLITATVKRVELDSLMSSSLAPRTICQSLVALNLAGVDPAKEEFQTYVSRLACPEQLEQLSAEEKTVLSTLCETVHRSSGVTAATQSLSKAISSA